MNHLLILFGTLLATLSGPLNTVSLPIPAPLQATEKASSDATSVQMEGDIQKLPFTMVREFPFVDAEINGTKGTLMFDTGNQDALSLNSNLLTNLGDGKVVGTGFVGSGQRFSVILHSRINHVVIGTNEIGFNRTGVINVKSQNLNFLESITPDCLGWLGYNSFEGYLMKLDYANKMLTFYKDTEARRKSQDFLKGETVLAILPFETRRLPNHPLIHLKVGKEEFLGAFDTGQIGMVNMTEEMQKTLTDQHLLTPLSSKQTVDGSNGDGVMVCKIEGIQLSGISNTITTSVTGVPVFNKPGPASVAMGTPEKNIISLGYAFLSQYKTVWDYPNKKIYLLKK